MSGPHFYAVTPGALLRVYLIVPRSDREASSPYLISVQVIAIPIYRLAMVCVSVSLPSLLMATRPRLSPSLVSSISITLHAHCSLSLSLPFQPLALIIITGQDSQKTSSAHINSFQNPKTRSVGFKFMVLRKTQTTPSVINYLRSCP